MKVGSLGSVILVLATSVAPADTRTEINVFQFFEFTMTPIAIKWACGGPRDQDLALLDAMIAANPEDAKEAELASIIELLVEISKREDGVSDLLEFAATDKQVEQICSVALPLELGVPMIGGSAGKTEDEAASELDAKWAAFWGVIEEWQKEGSL